MLSNAQEKLIRSLQTKKGRAKHGLCLVEGEKVIEVAGDAVVTRFTRGDVLEFDSLVTTETPQDAAAIARIPVWSLEDIQKAPTILVLDGVQDPGNVGALLRLCLGFSGSVILIDSVDVTNPKVVRSSVGALFQVPWVVVSRSEAEQVIANIGRPVYRLEKGGEALERLTEQKEILLVVGSEGNGVQLPIEGVSVAINHSDALESLNVGHAVAIALHARFTNR
ncbi:TPA: hypothetical protein DEB00_01980 [Candidatus Uhrbacteria bacterium]|nr:hypothetical protein [Candidatus Uhrbacteria bacterium]